MNQQAIPAADDYNPSASANNQIVGTIPGITNVPQSAVRAQPQQQSMNSKYMQGLSTQRKDDQTVQRSGITDWASIRTKDEGERFIAMLDSKQLARLRRPVQASYVGQYNNPVTKCSNVLGEASLRANDEYVLTLLESARIFQLLTFHTLHISIHLLDTQTRSQPQGKHSQRVDLTQKTSGSQEHDPGKPLATENEPARLSSAIVQPGSVASNTPDPSSDIVKKAKTKKRASSSLDLGSKRKHRKVKHGASGNPAEATLHATDQSSTSQSSLTQSSTGQSSLESGLNNLKESRKRYLAKDKESRLQPSKSAAESLTGHSSSISDGHLFQKLVDSLQTQSSKQPVPSRVSMSSPPPSTLRLCDQINIHGYDLRTGPRSARMSKQASKTSFEGSDSDSDADSGDISESEDSEE